MNQSPVKNLVKPYTKLILFESMTSKCRLVRPQSAIFEIRATPDNPGLFSFSQCYLKSTLCGGTNMLG
jgi:hypothetical protein